MKAYVKPAMMALSISANDMLCTSCTVKTRENKVLSGMLDDHFNTDGSDGIFSEAEADSVGAFGPAGDCENPMQMYEYCKYTATESNYQSIFNS